MTTKTLSSTRFNERLQAGKLVLTLVGMSNVGKSYWSEQLAQQLGFRRLCCDDVIEASLEDILQKQGFAGGIADVASWMGQPYDSQFLENQQTYLDLETGAMEAIIEELERGVLAGNIVIDTTGSVVHTHPRIRERLAALSTVVYLEATSAMQQEMFERYIAEPKPVVWGDVYCPEANESSNAALARCYPKLLACRAGLYQAMSQVTISWEALANMTSSGGFLDCVKASLITDR